MAQRGVDYAFTPHPPVTALKSAGLTFVGRYVSSQAVNDTNGKNLVPGEQRALHGAGLKIILFAEEGGQRMTAGQDAGAADANHFKAVTNSLGMDGAVMFCCCDFDAAPGQQGGLNAYLDGAASVLGRDRVGIYGGYYVVRRSLDAGKAHYACQTLAWSGAPHQGGDPHNFWDGQTNWDTRAQLRQHLQIRVSGVSVDFDEALATDYGQWPRLTPSPQPKPAPVPPASRSADGEQSLREAAQAESTTVPDALWLMARNKPDRFGDLQRQYIGGEDWDAPMPKGMTYWVG
jgi:hypothetical protein